jgi:large subunit ribosomal protein L37Ae
MTRTAKVGQSGSFGPRYGTVARKRYTDIISTLRKRSECPRCHITAVRRESVGVWLCYKCGYKFAGGAYVPETKLGDVARRATRGTGAGTIATALGLVQTPERSLEQTRTRVRKRVRRKKAAETSEEAQ